jgi:hypothetical protein
MNDLPPDDGVSADSPARPGEQRPESERGTSGQRTHAPSGKAVFFGKAVGLPGDLGDSPVSDPIRLCPRESWWHPYPGRNDLALLR